MLTHPRGPITLLCGFAAACASGAGPDAGSDNPGPADTSARATYWVYVGAESADLMHRIRFGPEGASIERSTVVGELATETEGPHGFKVSPDGRHVYMTTGHGFPDGKLWKLEAGPDTVVAEPILLGFFPATVDLTPDGLYAFVANFNLHGEHVPSTISVVYTPDLVEVEQIETCTMPHGGRMAPDGIFFYSNCMMDDQTVEIDTRTFEVSRRFSVGLGHEGPLGATGGSGGPLDSTGAPAGAGNDPGPSRMSDGPTCSPTWVQPTPDGLSLYVACNGGDRILHIDRGSWSLVREMETGVGPYNMAITPDGRLLVATLKQGAGVEFFDLESGESLARAPSSTTVTHGVVVSPDSRYAFVSVEGKGSEPGKVDIFDLESFRRVAEVEVGQQAGGIAFWRMETG